MTKNPWNAMTLVADSKGVVSMWAPSYKDYSVKMLCHKGPVKDFAVDSSGNYLVTSGLDRTVKVFDVRMFKELNSYHTGHSPASSLALSQRNVLAMSTGTNVRMYKNFFTEIPKEPYLIFYRDAQVEKMRFVPYEDVLGIGHSQGLSSILVPGSAEPNFDTFVDNPFINTKQLREHVVSSLLQKVQPDLIQLDPDFVGEFVAVDPKTMWKKNLEKKKEDVKLWKPKVRNKGKQGAVTASSRKQKGKWDKQRDLIKEVRDSDFEGNKQKRIAAEANKKKQMKKVYGTALHRFAK